MLAFYFMYDVFCFLFSEQFEDMYADCLLHQNITGQQGPCQLKSKSRPRDLLLKENPERADSLFTLKQVWMHELRCYENAKIMMNRPINIQLNKECFPLMKRFFDSQITSVTRQRQFAHHIAMNLSIFNRNLDSQGILQYGEARLQ